MHPLSSAIAGIESAGFGRKSVMSRRYRDRGETAHGAITARTFRSGMVSEGDR